MGGAQPRTVRESNRDWAGGGRLHYQGLGGTPGLFRYGRWRGTWQQGGANIICIYIYNIHIVYIGISCYTFINTCIWFSFFT